MTDSDKDFVGPLVLTIAFSVVVCVGILADCAKADAGSPMQCVTKSCASGTAVPVHGGRCVCVVGEAK